MKFIYPAVFKKKTDGGYAAYFPDLEFCEASGETLDDAIDNANEAPQYFCQYPFLRRLGRITFHSTKEPFLLSHYRNDTRKRREQQSQSAVPVFLFLWKATFL